MLDQKDNVKSMVLLEAHGSYFGAIARNGEPTPLPSPDYLLTAQVATHALRSIKQGLTEKAENFNMESTAKTVKSIIAHYSALRDIVNQENTDCDFIISRSMDVVLDEKIAKKAKRSL